MLVHRLVGQNPQYPVVAVHLHTLYTRLYQALYRPHRAHRERFYVVVLVL